MNTLYGINSYRNQQTFDFLPGIGQVVAVLCLSWPREAAPIDTYHVLQEWFLLQDSEIIILNL
jgi:hypothetical protein